MTYNLRVLGFYENRGPIACTAQLDPKMDPTGVFSLNQIALACIPGLNLGLGLERIIKAITGDDSVFNLIEADRGLKFRAIMILVGMAELCGLGLLVHGVASLYFAATEPPVEENSSKKNSGPLTAKELAERLANC